MNLRRLTARVTVAGISTAVAAGALVGLGTTAADAASGTATYTCSLGGSTLPVAMTAAADLSAYPSLATGSPVAANLVSLDLSFTIPAEVVHALVTTFHQDQIGGGSSNLAFPMGTGSVPIQAFSIAPVALSDGSPATLATKVANGAFKLPDAGNAAITMPKSFTLTTPLGSLPCTTSSQPTLTTYTISQQTASVSGKAPKSVKKNKKFNIAATVAGLNRTATGKVVAKAGKKVLGTGTLKNGKAAIKVKKGLKKTTKITLVYSGDKNTKAGQSFPIKVTVKK